MPINRTPYNALVDDSGLGLDGSIWNKAAIASVLLNPVDSALGGDWVDVPYSAANFLGSGAMTWTVDPGDVTVNRILRLHKIAVWDLQLAATTLGGTAGNTLRLVMPTGYAATRISNIQAVGWLNEPSVGPVPAYATISGSAEVGIIKNTTANFTLGVNALYLYTQIIFGTFYAY